MLVTNKKILRAKTEVTKGTGLTPDTAGLVYDPQFAVMTEAIPNNGTGLGSGGQLAVHYGPEVARLSFKYRLRGNGVALTPNYDPLLLILLQACGMKLATGVLTPCGPGDQKTCSLSFNYDGELRVLSGCAGKFTLSATAGKFFEFNFEFMGISSAPSAEAFPALTLPTVADLKMAGTTFTVDSVTPVINAWTFDPGFVVNPNYDATSAEGILHYYVSNRAPTLTIDPQRVALATYNWDAKRRARTLIAVSLTIGASVGNKFIFTAPKAQVQEHADGDREGVSTSQVKLLLTPDSGDDEFSITCVQPS